jgi:CTP synthase
MEHQKAVYNKWGTMRLWEYPAKLEDNSLAQKLYQSTMVSERHRHRYEVNPMYHNTIQDHGMNISWLSPDWFLAEFIEIPTHPYFIATQAHPEFLSRVEKPHPLFVGLIGAALDR